MSDHVNIKTLESGRVLEGRYQVGKQIAVGGMGNVYRAIDLENNHFPLALKVLHEGFKDPQYLKRFKQEVEICQHIAHPNVVKILDLYASDELTFFVMELIEGLSLEEGLKQGPFDLDKLPRLLIELADGLRAIHQQGIVHRDLKPGNIMIQEDGSAKIIDFGISRVESSRLTKKNVQIGSAPYIAPELWLGKKASPQSDFYSLGCLLYQLVKNQMPYQAENVMELMKLHTEAAVPELSELNDLNELLQWLMAKKLADRPANSQEVIDFIHDKFPKSKRVQTFDEYMQGSTVRSGKSTISVFPSLSIDKNTIKDVGVDRRTLLFSLLATRPAYLPPDEVNSLKRGKTVVLKLPKKAALVFEFEFPSWDFLFLGLFLGSLQFFDWYLTGQGIARFGTVAEGNFLLRVAMERFGPEQALLFAKGFAVLIVLFLTVLARRMKFVRNVVATLSIIYLCAAIIPWIYILFYR